jgi:hypothetical protein
VADSPSYLMRGMAPVMVRVARRGGGDGTEGAAGAGVGAVGGAGAAGATGAAGAAAGLDVGAAGSDVDAGQDRRP